MFQKTGSSRMIFLVFITSLWIVCCKSIRKPTYVNNEFSVLEEGEMLIKELNSTRIDTIIGYYRGCSGCISGANQNEFYIFWYDHGREFVKRISEVAVYKAKPSKRIPLNFFDKNMNDLKEEKLISSNEVWSHFHWEKVWIIIRDNQHEFELKYHQKILNEGALKVIFIDKIKSSIFEMPTMVWEFEKVH